MMTALRMRAEWTSSWAAVAVLLYAGTVAAVMAPGVAVAGEITVAHRSGVAGWPFSIYGTNFGTAQDASTVTINGASAAITSWSSTLIKGIVPSVPAGKGSLVVTVGSSVSAWPFEVYTIGSAFLAKPKRIENIMFGRPVVVQGTYTGFGTPSEFLTNNTIDGYCDLSPSASISMDLGEAMIGDVWLQFSNTADWYPFGLHPISYTVRASADSSNGVDGNWTLLLAVTDNAKAGRFHRLTLSAQRWLKFTVLSGNGSGGVARIRELAVHRVKTASAGGTGIDSWGVIGDSITAGNMGGQGINDAFWGKVRTGRNDGTGIIAYPMGISGAKSDCLSDVPPDPTVSLITALSLEPDMRYVGMSFGANDLSYANPAVDNRSALANGIARVIARGGVPIISRMAPVLNAQTWAWDESSGKSSTIAILRNVDELAALNGLPPGPDFFGLMIDNRAGYGNDGVHYTGDHAGMWAAVVSRLDRTSIGAMAAVSPASLAFGDVTIGASRAKTITISNAGTDPLTGAATLGSGTSGEYTFSPHELGVPAGGTQIVTVTYSPVGPNSVGGQLVLTTNDPGHPTIPVMLAGRGVTTPTSNMSLTPSALEFGTVEVGTRKQLPVQVANTGTASLEVSAISRCTNPVTSTDFSWSPVAPLTLAAGETATLTVTYAARAVEADAGCLMITSADQQVATVGLRANGSAEALSSGDGATPTQPKLSGGCNAGSESTTFATLAVVAALALRWKR